MCCLKLFCIHSINTHIEPHILISHVSEDDGLFTWGLMVSPLVVKGLTVGLVCVDEWLKAILVATDEPQIMPYILSSIEVCNLGSTSLSEDSLSDRLT